MNSIKEKSYWRNFYFLDKYFVSQVKNNRKKFLKIFRNNIFYNKESKLLDVGTTPSLDDHENYLINKFPTAYDSEKQFAEELHRVLPSEYYIADIINNTIRIAQAA